VGEQIVTGATVDKVLAVVAAELDRSCPRGA
jgi:hypothetical protein